MSRSTTDVAKAAAYRFAWLQSARALAHAGRHDEAKAIYKSLGIDYVPGQAVAS